MPTLDTLANQGLRYNRFHTTALCSPTRTALLTGRNHHITNAGAIMELATAFPGNTGVRPDSVAPLAEILRLNGYSTAAFGKYHETAPWEVSRVGPVRPLADAIGFDKFYGFIGGETNQWAPAIYDGMIRVEPPRDPNYHFTTDMTNQAIAWARFQQAMTPDKPFYMYFAPGATHAPHHVPAEWIDEVPRQVRQGLGPAARGDTGAPDRAGRRAAWHAADRRGRPEIPAWDSLSADQKRLFARQMEVFAGFGEHTDHEVGRLVQAFEDMGADGQHALHLHRRRQRRERRGRAGRHVTTRCWRSTASSATCRRSSATSTSGAGRTPSRTSPSAGRTPTTRRSSGPSRSRRTSAARGTRWSCTGRSGIKAHGEIRSQFHHVIDVAPTVLEAAEACREPKSVERHQADADGRRVDAVRRSTTPRPRADARRSTSRCSATERSTTTAGWPRRGTRSRGWWCRCRRSSQDRGSSTTSTRTSARPTTSPPRTRRSSRSCRPCSTKEAIRNHVYPIDDRRVERFDASIAGRPDLMGPRTSLTLYEGMTGIKENAFINMKGRSYNDHGRRRDARRRRERSHHLAGRAVRRLEPVHEGRPGRTTSTTSAACSASPCPRRRRCRRAATRCATSSSTTAGRRDPAARDGCSWTASRPARSAWRAPCRSSSRLTRGPMSAWTTRRRSPRSTREGNNHFTGRILKVTVDMKPPPKQ